MVVVWNRKKRSKKLWIYLLLSTFFGLFFLYNINEITTYLLNFSEYKNDPEAMTILFLYFGSLILPLGLFVRELVKRTKKSSPFA